LAAAQDHSTTSTNRNEPHKQAKTDVPAVI
jgi:hypothetical protein